MHGLLRRRVLKYLRSGRRQIEFGLGGVGGCLMLAAEISEGFHAQLLRHVPLHNAEYSAHLILEPTNKMDDYFPPPRLRN